MMTIRRHDERGVAEFGWLSSRHTFSFGHYHDPEHMGFGDLRVINEDRVAPGGGFETHGHRDMEILSYVLYGALAHQDSLGNGSIIRPGEVQRMSAGTGIRHSEFNASNSGPSHFLQIWILPERKGLAPGYEQKAFPPEERRGRFCLLAGPNGRDGAVTLHQDAELFGALLNPGETVTHQLRPGRRAWFQVARGRIDVNGVEAAAGDGVALVDESTITVTAAEPSELLLFDLR